MNFLFGKNQNSVRLVQGYRTDVLLRELKLRSWLGWVWTTTHLMWQLWNGNAPAMPCHTHRSTFAECPDDVYDIHNSDSCWLAVGRFVCKITCCHAGEGLELARQHRQSSLVYARYKSYSVINHFCCWFISYTMKTTADDDIVGGTCDFHTKLR